MPRSITASVLPTEPPHRSAKEILALENHSEWTLRIRALLSDCKKTLVRAGLRRHDGIGVEVFWWGVTWALTRSCLQSSRVAVSHRAFESNIDSDPQSTHTTQHPKSQPWKTPPCWRARRVCSRSSISRYTPTASQKSECARYATRLINLEVLLTDGIDRRCYHRRSRNNRTLQCNQRPHRQPGGNQLHCLGDGRLPRLLPRPRSHVTCGQANMDRRVAPVQQGQESANIQPRPCSLHERSSHLLWGHTER